MVEWAHERADTTDGHVMASLDDSQTVERMRRELANIRSERDNAERQLRDRDLEDESPQRRLDRAAALIRIRTATEERLIAARREHDQATNALVLSQLAAAGVRAAAQATATRARDEAIRVVQRARQVAEEVERRALHDAERIRAAAAHDAAAIRSAAAAEVQEARRLRLEAEHVYTDARHRWVAANEAMHQAAERVAEPTPAVSVDGDTIWLNQDSVDELDDRFEKYFAMELNDDSAREWMLGRRGA
jgi:hypothetical protein